MKVRARANIYYQVIVHTHIGKFIFCLPESKNVLRKGRSAVQHHPPTVLLQVKVLHALGRQRGEIVGLEVPHGAGVGNDYAHSGVQAYTPGREGAVRDALVMKILHPL